MKAKLLLAVTVVLVIVGLWGFYQMSAIAARGGEDSPLYSAERHDPYGTAALLDLLIERGVPASLWHQPAPGHGSGMVLIRVLSNSGGTPTPGAERRLTAWMEEGNTIIEFTRVSTALMQAQGLTVDPAVANLAAIETAEAHGKPRDEVGASGERVLWAARPTLQGSVVLRSALPSKAGALNGEDASDILAFDSPAVLQAKDPATSTWRPLSMTPTHQWVAAVRPVGKGRMIVVGSPTPVLNYTLGERANLDFVLSLLGPPEELSKTRVYFDEWSHGLGRDGTIIGFIRDVGLMPVIFQLMAVLALYVWATSGFTLPVRGGAARRRSSAEQIDTLGYLYQQSLKPDFVFEKVYAEVRWRIAGVLHCPPASLEAALARAPEPMRTHITGIFGQLEQIGRTKGPTCPACGYELLHNTTGKCPECGAAIDWRQKERIAKANEMSPLPERQKNQRRTDARLAAVLRDSHLFVEEHVRDRRRRS